MNKNLSKAMKAAWKRRRKFAPVVLDGHNRIAAVRGQSFSQIAASALAFIKAAGGMANAKATIAMIEQVREAV